MSKSKKTNSAKKVLNSGTYGAFGEFQSLLTDEEKKKKVVGLLGKYDIDEIIKHYGVNSVLYAIGKDKVKSYLRKKKIKNILDND